MKSLASSRSLLVRSLYKTADKVPSELDKHFHFDSLTYKQRHTIYRLYREKLSAREIATHLKYPSGGLKGSAFCEQWPITLKRLIGEFESPLHDASVPGYGKSTVELNQRELNLIKMAVIAGRSAEEIAKLLGMGSKAFIEYRKKNPKIDEYIKSGYEEELLKVEYAIYKRAKGMVMKETRLASFQGIFTDTKDINVQYLPDPRSAELVMVNKRGWRSGNVGNPAQSSEKGKILQLIEELTQEEPTNELPPK